MTDSSIPYETSQIVRANLQQAKAKLVAQQTDLVLQLEQIRKGIESIETTLSVISPESALSVSKAAMKASLNGSTPAIAPAAVEVTRSSKTAESSVKTSTKGVDKKAAKTTHQSKQKPARKSASAQPTQESSSINKDKKAARSKTASEKVSKRGATGWQSYMFNEFTEKPLTEVVETVLSRSPGLSMSSSDLINRIFKPDMPKPERVAARDRLLNILSIGVNENKWYRVKLGQYSLSRTAARA